MAPSAAAAVEHLVRPFEECDCFLLSPVVCRRMPRRDKGRGVRRRHVDKVHIVWRMSTKTCRLLAFLLRRLISHAPDLFLGNALPVTRT